MKPSIQEVARAALEKAGRTPVEVDVVIEQAKALLRGIATAAAPPAPAKRRQKNKTK